MCGNNWAKSGYALHKSIASIDSLPIARLLVLMNRFWLVPVVFAVFVIGPFLVWGDKLSALFTGQGAIEVLGAQDSFAWIIGIGLLVADIFLPIPTTAIIAALGIYYGPVIGTLVSLTGSVAAALVGYGIGRILGRPAAQQFIGDAIETGESVFARYGGWIVAASRWMPVLPEVISCVAGVSRMPLALFLGAVICGALPLCMTFAVVGHLGAEEPGWTLALSALAPIALWFVADRLGLPRFFGTDSRSNTPDTTEPRD